MQLTQRIRTGLLLLLAVSIQACGPVRPTAGVGSAVAPPARNVVIFVADGLRAGSVNATDAPTLLALREEGVSFINSHSLFPTFTTPNASAIATGHYLGDTGDFSNSGYVGFPIFNRGNFGRRAGTPTPFLENDQVLGDLNTHFSNGRFLNETTLLAEARAHGFSTAAIGKLGPVAIQDVTQVNPVGGQFVVPQTVILDDSTGTDGGVPLSPDVLEALQGAGLPVAAPVREQSSGNLSTPGTSVANLTQQEWFVDATTKAVLPLFGRRGKPFVLVYWSRDPDGTQHSQGDSLNSLVPGINGATSRAAVKNADDNLRQILDLINGDPQLRATTDIFVTADHGFATISRREIDAMGHATSSYAAGFRYQGAKGQPEVLSGGLPPGFLAIDLAHALSLPLFDADSQIETDGTMRYVRVDPTRAASPISRQHPVQGNALIGGTGAVLDRTDARVIVSVGGGSDLIYVPDHDAALVRRIVAFLSAQDYVGGLFVDRAYGRVAGALPLNALALEGTAQMPRPAIVVAFKSFATDPANPLMSAAQISDTTLQEGQGMHGGFGRESTFNFMAALGPDFKRGFVDRAPVSNADIARTLGHILKLEMPATGSLTGRVVAEALSSGPPSASSRSRTVVSAPAASGRATVLEYQEAAGRLYFDRACFIDVRGPSHSRSTRACGEPAR